jgi:hypothetical protein
MKPIILKNLSAFAIGLISWLFLISIEVYTSYTGIALTGLYLAVPITLFAVFKEINNPYAFPNPIKPITSNIIAVVITLLFISIGIIIGVNFKFLIGGTI